MESEHEVGENKKKEKKRESGKEEKECEGKENELTITRAEESALDFKRDLRVCGERIIYTKALYCPMSFVDNFLQEYKDIREELTMELSTKVDKDSQIKELVNPSALKPWKDLGNLGSNNFLSYYLHEVTSVVLFANLYLDDDFY